MTEPNLLILYVDSPTQSAAFYADLLGAQPVEASPTFVLFAMSSGMMLGMWSRHTVAPAATVSAGSAELVFKLSSKADIDLMHLGCCNSQRAIEQAPCQMDFGYTFVALDPDGHRLRFFAPSAQ